MQKLVTVCAVWCLAGFLCAQAWAVIVEGRLFAAIALIIFSAIGFSVGAYILDARDTRV